MEVFQKISNTRATENATAFGLHGLIFYGFSASRFYFFLYEFFHTVFLARLFL